MSKQTYEVTVAAFATVVVVNADSEEEAMRLSMQEIDKGAFVNLEANCEPLEEKQIDSAKRHADLVI